MKITLINRDDMGGGAAMACLRLFRSLKEKEISVNMLVQSAKSGDFRINSTIHGKLDEIKASINFYSERLPFILQERDPSVRFAFSTANAGTDITKETLVSESELLHLHWINGAFLGLKDIQSVLNLNKPIVWTLHDMWPFTGGCHYSGICDHFHDQCGNCYYLKHPHKNDISREGWLKKLKIFENSKIVFVACSNWMREEAAKSSLLQGKEVITIPNAIDTNIYSVRDKHKCRNIWNVPVDAKVILFGAANINHTRKGIKYLIEALKLARESGELNELKIHIVVFGKSRGFDFTTVPYPVTILPVIKSEKTLADIYSLADVFVLPSLEDNLPNMVMESLSCAVPVVAFNVGGLRDLIDHLENGYLAEFGSAKDLAKGIISILKSSHYSFMSLKAREKVLKNFSNAVIAEKHVNLYKRLLQ